MMILLSLFWVTDMCLRSEDLIFMKIAIKLAHKGRGFTEPNPLVGAVVVKNGKIISYGFHKSFGQEHAEKMALKHVTEKNTTLYVPLEPCSHYGKTPPCTDLIIKKKVKRVVISIKDPNPVVGGTGVEKLIKNNIKVDLGCLKDVYSEMNRHYLKYMKEKKPYVTIKAGVSIDSKLTDKYRKSKWITDKELRDYSHSLRGEFSAILVGVKTIIEDNPILNIREKIWLGKKLYRIVLDSNNIMTQDLKIFRDQENFPLIIFSSRNTDNKNKKVKDHFFVKSNKNGLYLREVLQILYKKGVASVLVEGGGNMIDSFLKEKLYDEIILFCADKLIGGKESVELLCSGVSTSNPIIFKKREILEFDSGYILRGFK